MSRPTIAETVGTLDELAAAVRARDVGRYRTALALAREQEITDEQIKDAFRYGLRTGNLGIAGPVLFSWAGAE